MTFEAAITRYINRFTAEHVPTWARKATPNGKYYAPQFASDREWFENTLFPPFHPLGRRVTDCYTTGQTWPLGQSLSAPYDREVGLDAIRMGKRAPIGAQPEEKP